jgi:CheY-like chemotaxis protein
MNQATFSNLFKDLIARLFDRVAVETHPLAAHFPTQGENPIRRAENIQRMVQNEIEALRPAGPEIQVQSSEWRPYLILHKRYVQGENSHDIAAALYIGDRQYRRDHSRALQALSLRMWEQYFRPDGEGETITNNNEEPSPVFEINTEMLDLHEVVQGVLTLIERRLKSERIELNLELRATSRQVFTDRILLRQTMLGLFNYALHLAAQPSLTLRSDNGPSLCLQFSVDEQSELEKSEERESLEFVRMLSHQISARLIENYPLPGHTGLAEFTLYFPSDKAKTVLVIDDQPAALKMFQRYLSLTRLQVSGLNDPSQALDVIRQTHPALIILDVMMPRIDGWEILQALKLDPQTSHIPVIVCSAWGEPELARSLGATNFLKKPVVQQDLLNALNQIDII